MQQYHNTLQRICDEGVDHTDRTGVGRRSIFGTQDRYNMADGFPLVTTRHIYTKAIIHELLWFIRGSFNAQELSDQNVKIWQPWMVSEDDITAFATKYAPGDEEMQSLMTAAFKDNKLGTIGMMYGAMWRNAPQSIVHTLWPDVLVSEMPSDKIADWTKEYEELVFVSKDEVPSFEQFIKIKYYSSVDQLNDLVNNLKKRPYSSRHVVTAWIPSHVPFEQLSPQENVLMERGALAACHAMFQCFVYPPKEEGGKNQLSLMMTIRSNDITIGAPYNIAQYSLLLHMLAQVCDMEPYEYIHSVGDNHIYLNHFEKNNPELKEGVETQLARTPRALPRLWLNPNVKDLFAFKPEDIEFIDYDPYPPINYPVAK